MARNQLLTDPAAFLKDLIVRKGESQQYACVFRGANLLFDPNEHLHSDTHDDTMGFIQRVAEKDGKYRRMITYLSHADTFSSSYTFKEYFGLTGVACYVNKTPTEDFSVTVTFPMINASRFHLDIEIFSHIANLWARIAGKDIREMRVFIDTAFLRWEDMEEENLLFTEFESD